MAESAVPSDPSDSTIIITEFEASWPQRINLNYEEFLTARAAAIAEATVNTAKAVTDAMTVDEIVEAVLAPVTK